jgi:hypothetical protein
MRPPRKHPKGREKTHSTDEDELATENQQENQKRTSMHPMEDVVWKKNETNKRRKANLDPTEANQGTHGTRKVLES